MLVANFHSYIPLAYFLLHIYHIFAFLARLCTYMIASHGTAGALDNRSIVVSSWFPSSNSRVLLSHKPSQAHCKPRSQGSHGYQGHDVGSRRDTGALLAVRSTVSRGVAGGRLPRHVLHGDALGGGAVAGRLGVLVEPDVGAVVQGGAARARRDDLQRRQRAVLHVDGHGELVDAQGPLAGDVPELRGERDVEVGRVLAQPEVDKDVGPGVVQVEGEESSPDGPVCHVAGLVVDAGTWYCQLHSGVLSSSRCGAGLRTWIAPLAVFGFILGGERVCSPRRVRQAKVGCCAVDSGQRQDERGQHLVSLNDCEGGKLWEVEGN